MTRKLRVVNRAKMLPLWSACRGVSALLLSVAVIARTAPGDDAPTRLYVANYTGNSITVIDGPEDQRDILLPDGLDCGTEAPPPPASPSNVALSSDGSRLYVGAQTCHVLIIDTCTLAVSTFRVSSLLSPTMVQPSETGRFVYFTEAAAPRFCRLDVADRSVACGRLDQLPREFVLTPNGDRAYVVATDPEGKVASVLIVDATTLEVRGNIALGGSSLTRGIALSPDGRRLYVATADAIDVLDVLGTPKQTRLSDTGATRIALSLDGLTLYATRRADNTVSAIDAQTGALIAAVEVGDIPGQLKLDGNNTLYVIHGSDTVSVVHLDDDFRVEAFPLSPCCHFSCSPAVICAPAGLAVGPIAPSCLGTACAGDCNADRAVTVDELLVAINLALSGTLPYCNAVDSNRDRVVTVDEVTAAVQSALVGCMHGNGRPLDVAAIRAASTLRTSTAMVYPTLPRSISSVIA